MCATSSTRSSKIESATEFKVGATIPNREGESTAGGFEASLNLQPLNNQPTLYRISVSYEGSPQGTAASHAYSPNGTKYAVTTTIQYGYKPVSNSTTLTVLPQGTTATQPTKTPEQLQAEAEQSGGLTVWHEFTWWYPWYRLHIKINVNPTIDIGFNPILPGGEVADWSGLEFFGALIGDILEETLIEAMAYIGTYLVARTVGLVRSCST